jgi:hypothetical protein
MITIKKVENGYLIEMLAYGNAGAWVVEARLDDVANRLGKIVLEVLDTIEDLRQKSEQGRVAKN